ncbi:MULTISPECIES: pyrroloquinoline-quinone synthase PqqC [Actinomadura]|uniref:Pyrroloquinoline-quinone synthase n=1 Tax=Actinomadura yumaensis TaxID=111807 RepID=A0ABW2CHV6_9ACTN|nr:pyrroloquinoline-quinone synthase PqqC [Actinomadura sp. J1-007]MWK34621.1 pyrroloquinoline-quinone synthase PqqC [Actinomadura sp. J1-007]
MSASARGDAAPPPWPPAVLEDRLRRLGDERYHHRHPFNVRMHEGRLSKAELRRWVLNRFHYQRHIPVKDALILAALDGPEQRRSWIRRVHDHDGRPDGDGADGGIERWLRLGEAVGLDRPALLDGADVLPGVRLAVDGYVNFCRNRPPLESVASSLTELFAPDLMAARVAAWERHYPWVRPDGLRYFRTRVGQGRRDSREALGLVHGWTRTRADQERVLAAFTFKCEVLWSLLDAVQNAEDAPRNAEDGDG